MLDLQTSPLNPAGCIHVFAGKRSGKNAESEELRKTLDYLRPGDTLVVTSPDRLGRSLGNPISPSVHHVGSFARVEPFFVLVSGGEEVGDEVGGFAFGFIED